jgi:hypothetical protein
MYFMKNLKVSILAISVFALVIALFGLPSCKQAAEKQHEKAMEKILEQGSGEKTDVDIDDQKITIENEEGKTEINLSEKNWPADAPSDVPELKAGKITGTTITKSENGKNWTIRYADVAMEELDKFAATLKSKGFKTQTIKAGKGGMVNGEKGNIGVIFTVGDKASSVIIMEHQPE